MFYLNNSTRIAGNNIGRGLLCFYVRRLYFIDISSNRIASNNIVIWLLCIYVQWMFYLNNSTRIASNNIGK